MVGATKKHVDELLKLPAEQRSEAAEALLLSLEQEPESDDQAAVAADWAREIERRVEENAPGVQAETVFTEGRARLQKQS
ncbi:MAG: addiction module protein [Deltaproteobacteria bacterium]|nr:addiction module protein [Deltaproteobacteria bacterium]